MRRFFPYILSLLPLLAAAQDPYYKVLDESDGLPNNAVFGLFQDSRGFIWIATDDGLCRYDGHAFKRYSSSHMSSKSGANIFEDHLHRIWYENFDGKLYYVSGDTLATMETSRNQGYSRAGRIGSRLYKPVPPYLLEYDLNTLQQTRVLGSPTDEWGLQGTPGERYYWVYGGIDARGIGLQGEVIKLPLKPGKKVFGELAFDYAGKVFAVSYGHLSAGIEILQGDHYERFADLHGTGDLQTHALADGKIWLCYPRGMEVVDATTGEWIHNRLIFPDKSISAILIDREGNHWFGTTNEGLMMVPDFESECLPTGGAGLTRLAQGTRGLYAGTQTGEVLLLDSVTKRFHTEYSITSKHAIDFLKVLRGKIVIGEPMMEILDERDSRHLQSERAVPKSLDELSDKYLAVSMSHSSSLLRWFESDSIAPDPYDSIAANHINILNPHLSDMVFGRGRAALVRQGAIYFGTGQGLWKVTPQSIQEIRLSSRQLYITQMALYQDRIYMLSTLGDLYMLDHRDHPTPLQHLPVPGPYKQIRIFGDHMYVCGMEHLMILNIHDPQPQFRNVISGLQPGSIKDIAWYRGRLALAADQGLILLHPDRKGTSSQPQLHITGLRVGGIPFVYDSLVEVDHHHDEIAIDYAILHYRTQGAFPLYYRINDRPWTLTHPDSRQLLLAQLSPGDYRIEFCLGAPNCMRSGLVRVRISPPFWRQTWFAILVLMALVGIVALIFWQRNSIQQRKHQAETERLELEHALRQSTLRAIRSQMNPHFLFNALNTIQAYIFSDDKKNAASYLGKFSKLTRLILEMSEREEVSLEEEIQSITLYLELEKSRFGEDFHFAVEVGPGISPTTIRIPSMIIQPYVENAVKHGLLHKSGPKSLKVSFGIERDMLVIQVEDDGIGRKRSAELNRLRQERHQSFAVQANAKRIDILNLGQNRIGVDYTDKEEPTGTRVTITLPLKSIPAHP